MLKTLPLALDPAFAGMTEETERRDSNAISHAPDPMSWRITSRRQDLP
jgi:hypothetical protein